MKKAFVGLALGLALGLAVAMIPTSTLGRDCGTVLDARSFEGDGSEFGEIMAAVREKACSQTRRPLLVASLVSAGSGVAWCGWHLGKRD